MAARWALGAFAPMASARPIARRSRNLVAAWELIARAGLTHARPPYGIDSVRVGNARGRR